MAKVLKKVRAAKSSSGGRLADVFEELPDRTEYPDYYQEIKQPIALDIIQTKIDRRDYKKLAELEADLILMVTNAKEYNREGSEIYQDAVELQALLDRLFGRISPEKEPAESKEKEVCEFVTVRGEVYRRGDFVYIGNPNSPDKPTISLIMETWGKEDKVAKREGVTVCWFLRPEQTVHKASQRFMEKEVFRTTHLEDYYTADIVGRCYVLHVRDYIRGRPKGAPAEHVYVCESRYDERAKQYAKIKDWANAFPKSARGREVELEPFSSPMVPNKVLSGLLGSSVPTKRGAKSVDDTYDSDGSSRAGRGDSPAVKPAKQIKFAPPYQPPVPAAQQLSAPQTGSSVLNTPAAAATTSQYGQYGGASATQTQHAPYGLGAQTNPYAPTYPYNATPVQSLTGASVARPSHSDRTTIPAATVNRFETNEEGKLKWFAAPPLDVVDNFDAVHSLTYLVWKAKKKLKVGLFRRLIDFTVVDAAMY
ncbi:hypothetical protein HDV00_001167 [Rhizophlyctis rosea]|nr:hypothetical protein HDV00_001167 [Rhizophlyctis rosea]